jgi:Restriction endonuclease
MRPKYEEYEQLVSEIAKDICQTAPELHGLVLGSGRNNRIRGASGYPHQIDVSLQETGRIFLIECKRWKKKIGAAEVLVLAGRVNDIQAYSPEFKVKAILGSMCGASQGARQLAQHFDIDIEIVTSASEFGLRIGRFVHQVVVSQAGFTDSATCTLTRGGVQI